MLKKTSTWSDPPVSSPTRRRLAPPPVMTCLLRTCLVPDGPLMWWDCPDVWLAVLRDDEPDAARTAGLVHRTEYQAEADRFFSEAFAAATGPPLQGKMLSDVRLVRRLDEVASLLPLRALRGRHGRAMGVLAIQRVGGPSLAMSTHPRNSSCFR